jgi:hypothetical protein
MKGTTNWTLLFSKFEEINENKLNYNIPKYYQESDVLKKNLSHEISKKK